VIEAYMSAQKDALETEREPVPLHLRNAPTGLMKRLGYGQGYQYAHNFESGRAEDMECLPENLRGRRYYKPEGSRQSIKSKMFESGSSAKSGGAEGGAAPARVSPPSTLTPLYKSKKDSP